MGLVVPLGAIAAGLTAAVGFSFPSAHAAPTTPRAPRPAAAARASAAHVRTTAAHVRTTAAHVRTTAAAPAHSSTRSSTARTSAAGSSTARTSTARTSTARSSGSTAPEGGAPALTRAEQIERCWQPPGRGVSLTFDDYGSTAQVKRIVAILDRNHVRGRFFPVGAWARANPDLVRYIEAHGHAVGNHTYDHPDLTRLSNAAVAREIAGGAEAYGSPALLRPPYGAGAFTTRIRRAAAAQGLKVCFWTVDTRDWAGASAARIVRRVLHGDATTPPARADGVVLMHMFGRHTAAALQPMIDGLRAKHLELEHT
jgi:peptidoglycan/xylan/chitin deacetylase (PgdA/CDA1 family)